MTITNWFESFFKYGEKMFSKNRLLGKLNRHVNKPIETTTELAEIIKSAKPAKELKKGHPAKQIFRYPYRGQWWTRCADESIQQAMDMLASRWQNISDYSFAEDRLTKQLFKEASTVEVPKGLPFIPDDLKPQMELVSLENRFYQVRKNWSHIVPTQPSFRGQEKFTSKRK